MQIKKNQLTTKIRKWRKEKLNKQERKSINQQMRNRDKLTIKDEPIEPINKKQHKIKQGKLQQIIQAYL